MRLKATLPFVTIGQGMCENILSPPVTARQLLMKDTWREWYISVSTSKSEKRVGITIVEYKREEGNHLEGVKSIVYVLSLGSHEVHPLRISSSDDLGSSLSSLIVFSSVTCVFS